MMINIHLVYLAGEDTRTAWVGVVLSIVGIGWHVLREWREHRLTVRLKTVEKYYPQFIEEDIYRDYTDPGWRKHLVIIIETGSSRTIVIDREIAFEYGRGRKLGFLPLIEHIPTLILTKDTPLRLIVDEVDIEGKKKIRSVVKISGSRWKKRSNYLTAKQLKRTEGIHI
ncbi:MAG: hypothetical protein WCH46_01115 [bacterium]